MLKPHVVQIAPDYWACYADCGKSFRHAHGATAYEAWHWVVWGVEP